MFCIDVHFTDMFVGKIIKSLHTLAFNENEAARGCTLLFLGWQKALFDTCALQIQNWYLGTSKTNLFQNHFDNCNTDAPPDKYDSLHIFRRLLMGATVYVTLPRANMTASTYLLAALGSLT